MLYFLREFKKKEREKRISKINFLQLTKMHQGQGIPPLSKIYLGSK